MFLSKPETLLSKQSELPESCKMERKILLDVSFPNERISRRFTAYCRRHIKATHALNGRKVYLVLNSMDERVQVLHEIKKLRGKLLGPILKN